MNPFDLINAYIQQQAARELADQLRPGYHLSSAARSFIHTLTPFWDQESDRQDAVTEVSERRWIEECQEWI